MLIKNINKTAFTGKDFSFTYPQLLRQINHYASLMPGKPGQKVLLFSENRPEWVFALYAAWKNNAVVVPVDAMSAPDEVAYILGDSRPEIILCSAAKKEVLASAITLSGVFPDVLIFEDTGFADINEKDTAPGFALPGLSDTALIVYTSGTTGNPKGVVLSFENLMVNVTAVSDIVPIYTEKENVLMLLPLHHILPLMGTIVLPFYASCTVALSPSTASEDIIRTLQENRISIIVGVPRLYNLIIKGIMNKIKAGFLPRLMFSIARVVNSLSFSRKLFKTVHNKFGGKLRYMVSGGAAIEKQVVQDFRTLGFEILEGYGMSEAAPMITFSRPSKVIPGSVGEPLPGVTIEIRDDEVVVKGKNITQGYYNKPLETNEVIKNGWLYTGDLGYLDKDGYLYITGRKKELIILSNGKNINPEEVEKKLLSITGGIKETGVYALNDTLQAVIYPDFNWLKQQRIENISNYFKWKVIDAYNAHVSPYKKILGFALVNEELPKTRLGKIQRFKLGNYSQQLKDRKKDETFEAFQEYTMLKNFLEDQLGKEVSPYDHLELDLSIDSLGLVSLSVFVHTSFGFNINENEFARFESVLKLAEHIRDNRSKLVIENIIWSDILKSPFQIQLPSSGLAGNFSRYLAMVFLKVYFRIRAEGLSNLPEGPCIIAPNHQSFFDGFFLNAIFKNKLMKKTYFYAKEKHFKAAWLKSFAKLHNIIIMDLNKDLKESIQKLAAVLKKGKNVIIFPEGTRTIDGTLGQFKKTFAILSQELNIPVVPVVINGSYRALPSGSWFPKPFSKITIKVLQPVYPDNHTYESLTNVVFSHISKNI
ncbi:MAG: AMP-binding protein [Bacteroidales bacterium]|nr:AMP-binding protein [Bacteroidales bacterium]